MALKSLSIPVLCTLLTLVAPAQPLAVSLMWAPLPAPLGGTASSGTFTCSGVAPGTFSDTVVFAFRLPNSMWLNGPLALLKNGSQWISMTSVTNQAIITKLQNRMTARNGFDPTSEMLYVYESLTPVSCAAGQTFEFTLATGGLACEVDCAVVLAGLADVNSSTNFASLDAAARWKAKSDPTEQQIVISEVHLEPGQELIELVNCGPTPMDFAGVGILIAIGSQCPQFVTGSVDGAVILQGTAMVPPGGTYVLKPGGNPGYALLDPSLGAGEHLGVPTAMSPTEACEIVVWKNAALSSNPNQPVTGDLQDRLALGSTIPMWARSRFGRVLGTLPSSAVYNVQRAWPGGWVYPRDADGNGDLHYKPSSGASHTGGQSNDNTGWLHSVNGSIPQIEVATPQGGAVTFRVCTGPKTRPFQAIRNLFGLSPNTCSGGPIMGLGLSAMPQLTAGVEPFAATTDRNGCYEYTTNLPPGLEIQCTSFWVDGLVVTQSDIQVFETQ